MEDIFKEIKKERTRQDAKFGIQNNKPIEWIAILMEEVGEASKEALENHFKYPVKDESIENTGTYYKGDAAFEMYNENRLLSYRKELIEVAAVCINAIENLDRDLQIKK
jgi:NTP pyrophosphatase (non-canonical NTP hydrolase)